MGRIDTDKSEDIQAMLVQNNMSGENNTDCSNENSGAESYLSEYTTENNEM